jgi:hypothetical protein
MRGIFGIILSRKIAPQWLVRRLNFLCKPPRQLQQRAQGHRADTHKPPSPNPLNRVAPTVWTFSGDSTVQSLLSSSQAPRPGGSASGPVRAREKSQIPPHSFITAVSRSGSRCLFSHSQGFPRHFAHKRCLTRSRAVLLSQSSAGLRLP